MQPEHISRFNLNSVVFLAISVPTKVVGMLVVSAFPTKVVGMQAVLWNN